MDLERVVQMCEDIYLCRDAFEMLVIEEALEIPCQIIAEQLEHCLKIKTEELNALAQKHQSASLLSNLVA